MSEAERIDLLITAVRRVWFALGTRAYPWQNVAEAIDVLRSAIRADILGRLDALVALAEERKVGADPFLIGIRPAAADWMTADEVHTLCELQAALVPYRRNDMLAAQERVAIKRAERRKLYQDGDCLA